MKVNAAFKPIFKELPRYSIIYGGAGSGKSYGIAQKVIIDCVQHKKKYLVIRKVAATLKDTVFEQLIEIISDLNISVKVNKTDKSIEFSTGSHILCKGLDDPEKIKSLTGITDCWVEEASELKYDDYRQLVLRLRGKGIKKRFILSFNPIDINHWLKKEFFDFPSDDIYILKTTYKDNAFLDDDYIKELGKSKVKDPYYYKVYCLGEWGEISGHRILFNVIVSEFEINQSRRLHYGLDFGYHDPNAAVECYIDDNCLYISKEWVKNGLDPDQFMSALKDVKWLNNGIITADSARPEIIRMLKSNGYRVQGAKKRVTGVKRRYKFAMAQYLKQFDHIIIHPSCENAAREFMDWKWATDRDDNPQQEPEDGKDHTVDATIYAIERSADKYYRSKTA